MENKKFTILTDNELQIVNGSGKETLANGILRVYNSIWPNPTPIKHTPIHYSYMPPYNPYGNYR
ncbi:MULTISPECIES: hypothetical protein [Lactococcus]|uniref:Bacteriocin n=2 Tax=Lactococcus TaxID=1357 RepID=A0ABV4D5J5_9LACT|nr:hypothetical protein [Lactococcus ileimucosae]